MIIGFKYFVIAFLLSAIGTIPVGVITLTIAQRTLKKGKNSGLRLALGATIPEFLYTVIALKSLDFLTGETYLKYYIQVSSIFIFLVLGGYYLFKKNKTKNISIEESDHIDFIHGIFTGTLNFLIIPFWLFIGVWLKSLGFTFDEYSNLFIFSIGAALGALIVFYGYIFLAETALKRSETIRFYANKIIGVLFLSLAIFQLLQLR